MNPLVLLHKGYLFASLKYRFRFADVRSLKRYHTRRLRQVCRFAERHSPFFHEYFKGVDTQRITPEMLWTLPGVTKSAMMADFGAYNTAGIEADDALRFARENDRKRQYGRFYQDRYSVGLSSGTTGASGLVIYSREETERSILMFMARNGLPRGLKRHRILFALRTSTAAFETVNRFGYHLVHVNYDTPPVEVIDIINRHDLNIIGGSPVFLLQLAPYASGIDHPLDTVVSYAEILDEHAKAGIARSFGTRVHELYAASEGYVAASCPEGTLHLNEDILLFNLLPHSGRPRVYRTVITDLYRTTQPIINFELSDLIEISDKTCPCGSGFRVLSQVIGRNDDHFNFVDPSGNERIVYADYIRRCIIGAVDGIREYSAIQRRNGTIELIIDTTTPGTGIQTSLRSAMTALLESYNLNAPKIQITFLRIDSDPSRKRKRVIRETSS